MWRLFEVISRVVGGVVFCLMAILFLPTVIAYTSARKHALLIGVVNVLLGWTLIGWAGAVIWAMTWNPVDLSRAEPRLQSKASNIPQPSAGQ